MGYVVDPQTENKVLELWSKTTINQEEIARVVGCQTRKVNFIVTRARGRGDPRARPYTERTSTIAEQKGRAARSGRWSEKQMAYRALRSKIAGRDIRGRAHPTTKAELIRLVSETTVEVKKLPPGEAWGRRGRTIVDDLA
jgi:hypothetical protein